MRTLIFYYWHLTKTGCPVLGENPFDPMVKQAINELKPVAAYPESSAGRQITMLWNRLNMKLKEDNLL